MKRSIAAALLCASLAGSAANGSPNRVESDAKPALTLEVHRGFEPIDPLRFPIDSLTNAERRIFVQAGPGRSIERMVIVQFEKVQPGSDFRFLFPSTPPRKFGAETYRFGTFVYDDEQAAAREPAKEAGRTRAFLTARGYTPAKLYRVARLARVSDPEGLSEVIIFYMENADRDPPKSAPEEPGMWSLAPDEESALAARLEAVIRPVRG